jgi:hypothetical protein
MRPLQTMTTTTTTTTSVFSLCSFARAQITCEVTMESTDRDGRAPAPSEPESAAPVPEFFLGCYFCYDAAAVAAAGAPPRLLPLMLPPSPPPPHRHAC